VEHVEAEIEGAELCGRRQGRVAIVRVVESCAMFADQRARSSSWSLMRVKALFSKTRRACLCLGTHRVMKKMGEQQVPREESGARGVVLVLVLSLLLWAGSGGGHAHSWRWRYSHS
jgi:hypothetical protein